MRDWQVTVPSPFLDQPFKQRRFPGFRVSIHLKLLQGTRNSFRADIQLLHRVKTSVFPRPHPPTFLVSWIRFSFLFNPTSSCLPRIVLIYSLRECPPFPLGSSLTHLIAIFLSVHPPPNSFRIVGRGLPFSAPLLLFFALLRQSSCSNKMNLASFTVSRPGVRRFSRLFSEWDASQAGRSSLPAERPRS